MFIHLLISIEVEVLESLDQYESLSIISLNLVQTDLNIIIDLKSRYENIHTRALGYRFIDNYNIYDMIHYFLVYH
jgi:hypothetical protein